MKNDQNEEKKAHPYSNVTVTVRYLKKCTVLLRKNVLSKLYNKKHEKITQEYYLDLDLFTKVISQALIYSIYKSYLAGL